MESFKHGHFMCLRQTILEKHSKTYKERVIFMRAHCLNDPQVNVIKIYRGRLQKTTVVRERGGGEIAKNRTDKSTRSV